MSLLARYNIPEENFPKLKAAMDKLCRKSERLNDKKIYCTVVGKHYEDDSCNPNIKHCIFEVMIGGPEPKLNGWAFVARIDHSQEGGNIILVVPGQELPESYRSRSCMCDHCGVNRYRRDTFVVRNEETGQYKQVGSTCLRDFLGHGDPSEWAKIAELLGYAHEAAQSCTNHMDVGGDRRYVDMERFAAAVAYFCRRNGYVSRKKAQESLEDIPTTASLALHLMFDQNERHMYSRLVTNDDLETAKKALEWMEEIDQDGHQLSDWEHNCKVLAGAPAIEFRHANLAASIVGVWFNKRAEQLVTRPSVHQGTAGERITRTVTVTRVNVVDTAYGRAVWVNMVDQEGNQYSWKNTGRERIDNGATYTITGKVKDHTEYQGAKITKLNYVKIQ